MFEIKGRVRLKPGEDERIRKGHIWIYDNEIAAVKANADERAVAGERATAGAREDEGVRVGIGERVETGGRVEARDSAGRGKRGVQWGEIQDGDLVWVEDASGRMLGTGFANLRSAIAVRLLTRGRREVFDGEEAMRRLSNAAARRAHLHMDCVRLVNSEGDYLPGLVIDRYGDVIVIQPGTRAWELRSDLVIDAISRVGEPRAIVLRRSPEPGRADSEHADRGREEPAAAPQGLPAAEPGGQPPVVVRGSLQGNVTVREGGIEVEIDVLGGQKTGFYIDQRENRASTMGHVAGRRVLDCFCYTGAWSCMCAAAGAAGVTGVDSSASALALAATNAGRNGVAERAAFVEADVFDYLPSMAWSREKYDVIILDPPSLARTRKQVAGAMRGYIHINKVAMGLLGPGGILVTCSCSHHMTRERFLEMLRHCSTLVKRRVSVLRMGGQPEDHPSLLGVPETDYLKCVTLRLE